MTQPVVGAALCRERAAKQPQGFSTDAHIAGAALQPFRDTRPLLHGTAQGRKCSTNSSTSQIPSYSQ
ncbi:hypothetical protein E5221_18815 [Pseudomonas sp. A2]|nr:hypothetical protein E5221_18815 [Pseudomonas sp. A2]